MAISLHPDLSGYALLPLQASHFQTEVWVPILHYILKCLAWLFVQTQHYLSTNSYEYSLSQEVFQKCKVYPSSINIVCFTTTPDRPSYRETWAFFRFYSPLYISLINSLLSGTIRTATCLTTDGIKSHVWEPHVQSKERSRLTAVLGPRLFKPNPSHICDTLMTNKPLCT